jgi:Ser/Thr protein kinase RdoA (MazF antagonist)
LALLFKDLSEDSLLDGARQARPAFLYDPLREIETYRTLLGPRRPGTPTYYGSVVDLPAARYWLFLEKVSGLELYQVGDWSVWQQVARWLAAWHSSFHEEELPEQAAAARLPTYDAGYFRQWIERACAFARSAAIEALAARYERVVERLLALPRTITHGEFYASNVLVTPGESLRVCPVDWETAAVGPGLIDLAALTAGRWTDTERADLARAYRAAWKRGTLSLDELLEALDYCRLHMAVQWLGWAPDWSPPPEHAHNWHHEVSRLVEKLRLC